MLLKLLFTVSLFVCFVSYLCTVIYEVTYSIISDVVKSSLKKSKEKYSESKSNKEVIQNAKG